MVGGAHFYVCGSCEDLNLESPTLTFFVFRYELGPDLLVVICFLFLGNAFHFVVNLRVVWLIVCIVIDLLRHYVMMIMIN